MTTALDQPGNRAQRRAKARKRPPALAPRDRRKISQQYAEANAAAQRFETETLADDQRQRLSQTWWISFRALADGAPEDPHQRWGELAQAVNIALMLAEAGIGEEFVEDLITAAGIVVQLKVRGLAIDSWRIREEEIAPLERALEVHDAQLEIATRQELLAACEELRVRMATGQILKPR